MTLTGEEARAAIYEDSEDWKVIETNIVDNSRWSIIHESILLHIPSQEYYRFSYSSGATENQDEQPYEYESEVTPQKVIHKEVTVKQWVDVKGGDSDD